jgi:hypothetical protein
MARSKNKGTGRGSPETVAKRRTARFLNAILLGGDAKDGRLDGRTAKRKKRLIKELVARTSGKAALKPIDLLGHASELMKLGETFASLRKQGVKKAKFEITDEAMKLAKAAQAAYGFHPQAWRILGITLPTVKPVRGKRKRGK